MSSKRHLRRKSCEGKVKHDHLTQAKYALEKTKKKNGHGVLGVYLCRFCGFWHVGHVRRKNMSRKDYQMKRSGTIQVSRG